MGDLLPGDGRLDLDDLGSVIERATSVDTPEVLSGADERPTWRERWTSSGIGRRVARHRVAVVAGAVALSLGVGLGVVAVVRRPPPQVTGVAVEVAPWGLSWRGDGTLLTVTRDDVISAGYVVKTPADGSEQRIDGVTGPGIRASSAWPDDRDRTRIGTVMVLDATYECDAAALRATDEQYRLRVSATDAWGRTTHDTAPMPGGGWAGMVRGLCWEVLTPQAISATATAVRLDTGGARVRVELAVRNGLPVPANVAVNAERGEDVTIPEPADAGRQITLDPGATGALALDIQVRDCTDTPSLPVVFEQTPSRGGLLVEERELPGYGLVVTSPEGDVGRYVPVAFEERTRVQLRQAFLQMCQGHPTAAVVTQRFSAGVQPVDGGTTEIGLDAVLTTGRGLRLAAGVPDDPNTGYSPDSLWDAQAVTAPGGGAVRLVWRISCDGPPAPPTIDLRFVDGVQPWPLRLPLDRTAALAAVLATCPGMTRDDVLTSGAWSAPGSESS